MRASRACSTPAYAEDLGTTMSIATWPNYHDPATFEPSRKATGVAVEVNVFGSNEEMLAKLQAGGSGWILFVPTNYTISTYVKLGLIDPLDMAKLPNFAGIGIRASRRKARSTARPTPCRRTGARPAWPSTPRRSRPS
jgi:spermidine/putrescine transport system substrate-binding protein